MAESDQNFLGHSPGRYGSNSPDPMLRDRPWRPLEITQEIRGYYQKKKLRMAVATDARDAARDRPDRSMRNCTENNPI